MEARGLIDGSNGVKQEGSCQQTVKATEFKFFKEDCLPRLWQFANTMKPKPSLVVLQNDFMEASWYEERLIKIFEKIPHWSSVRPKDDKRTLRQQMKIWNRVKNDSYAVSEGAERYFKPLYPSSISAEKLRYP
jgi:hypothetical protein